MKRLLSLIVLLFLSGIVLAYDNYTTLTFQTNPLCPFEIVLNASGAIEYQLTWGGGTIADRGLLSAGDQHIMALPLTDGEYYTLLVEWDEGDNPFSVETGLSCGSDPVEGAPQPSAETLEKLKPALDAMGSILKALMKTP